MTTAQAATKAPAPAGPLDEAEAEQEAARAQAADITAQIDALKRPGPGFDQAELAGLEAAQEVALKRLRAADLRIEEQRTAAAAPISARALNKIRAQRRKAYDAHAALIVRMTEATRLRAHRKGLENTVAEIQRSPEFRRDHQGVISSFVWGKNGKGPGDHRAPAADHRDSPETIKKLAELERSLSNTIAELELAQAAQAAAQAQWEGSKATLDNWESAVRAQGPAAVRALAEIPDAGVFDNQGLNPGSADIEIGSGKYSTRGMVS